HGPIHGRGGGASERAAPPAIPDRSDSRRAPPRAHHPAPAGGAALGRSPQRADWYAITTRPGRTVAPATDSGEVAHTSRLTCGDGCRRMVGMGLFARRASVGCSRAARKAGYTPENSPIAPDARSTSITESAPTTRVGLGTVVPRSLRVRSGNRSAVTSVRRDVSTGCGSG